MLFPYDVARIIISYLTLDDLSPSTKNLLFDYINAEHVRYNTTIKVPINMLLKREEKCSCSGRGIVNKDETTQSANFSKTIITSIIDRKGRYRGDKRHRSDIISSQQFINKWKQTIPFTFPNIYDIIENGEEEIEYSDIVRGERYILGSKFFIKANKHTEIYAVENSVLALHEAKIFECTKDGYIYIEFPFIYNEFLYKCSKICTVRKLKLGGFGALSAIQLKRALLEDRLNELESIKLHLVVENWGSVYSRNEPIYNDNLRELINIVKVKCPKLRELKLVSNKHLLSVYNEFPNITSFILYTGGQQTSNEETIMKSSIPLSKVKKLVLDNERFNYNRTMTYGFITICDILSERVNPGLEELTIEDSFNFLRKFGDLEPLKKVALRCPNLKKFKNYSCGQGARQSDKIHHALEVWNNLEFLEFNLCDVKKYVLLARKAVGNMRRLHTLKINLIHRATNQLAKKLFVAEFAPILKKMPSLKRLTLGHYFTPLEIYIFCENCKDLEYLALSFPIDNIYPMFREYTYIDFEALAHKLPRTLIKLKLTWWGIFRESNLCDPYVQNIEGIKNIIDCLPNLRCFEIHSFSSGADFEILHNMLVEVTRERDIVYIPFWRNSQFI